MRRAEPISKVELQALNTRWQEGDDAAGQELMDLLKPRFEQYARTVLLHSGWQEDGYLFDELIQEAKVAILMKLSEENGEAKNADLMYDTGKVRTLVVDAMRDYLSRYTDVTFPTVTQRELQSYNQAVAEGTPTTDMERGRYKYGARETGGESDDELDERRDFFFLKRIFGSVSLEQLKEIEGGAGVEDVQVDGQSLAVREAGQAGVDTTSLIDHLFDLAELTEKKRDIIRRRFGLEGYLESSYEDIAKELSTTESSVRYAEESGLREMRRLKARWNISESPVMAVERIEARNRGLFEAEGKIALTKLVSDAAYLGRILDLNNLQQPYQVGNSQVLVKNNREGCQIIEIRTEGNELSRCTLRIAQSPTLDVSCRVDQAGSSQAMSVNQEVLTSFSALLEKAKEQSLRAKKDPQ